ncbi:hypothetical protein QW180_26035 [Vibrio sinaloensis]|nr:hypothetical protein [Vibrio sinaloensis]
MNLNDRKARGYANSIIAMLDAGIDDAASYRLAIDSIFLSYLRARNEVRPTCFD